jgi:hypothetical protein
MGAAQHLANARERVEQYWMTYDGEKSQAHLKRNMAMWNRPCKTGMRGKRTYRDEIIRCLGAKVEDGEIWFVVGKEMGVTEELRIDALMQRYPDRYASFIDSAFP